MNEKRRASQKRYYERHKLKIRERKRIAMSAYRKTDEGSLSNRHAASLFRKNHPEKTALYAANRRYDKRIATPVWLTEEQKKQMRAFYTRRGPNEHVDHIIPLKGVRVCGLHVPWNLRLISKKENLIKGNNY